MALKIGDKTNPLRAHGRVLREHFGISPAEGQWVIALAGNPNVGKSTVFNALTGLRQHTGNWPGKTVDNAQGTYIYRNNSFLLVDLPGTYSLLAHSVEEEIARDFICFGKPDATVVVLDATSLERNLNLALQVLEITPKVVVCVNLIDEAKRLRVEIDFQALEQELGVPVVPTAARNKEGLGELKQAIYDVALGRRRTKPRQVAYSEEVERAIQQLMPQIDRLKLEGIVNPKWLALRLLDSDRTFIESISRYIESQWDEQDEPAQAAVAQERSGRVYHDHIV